MGRVFVARPVPADFDVKHSENQSAISLPDSTACASRPTACRSMGSTGGGRKRSPPVGSLLAASIRRRTSPHTQSVPSRRAAPDAAFV